MSRPARLHAHSAVSTALALHSDHALRELVDAAAPIGAGIGGKSALLEVAGTSVFVKRVPRTDLERQPEHVRSTANPRTPTARDSLGPLIFGLSHLAAVQGCRQHPR